MTDERPNAATVHGKEASVANAISEAKKAEEEKARRNQEILYQRMMPAPDADQGKSSKNA